MYKNAQLTHDPIREIKNLRPRKVLLSKTNREWRMKGKSIGCEGSAISYLCTCVLIFPGESIMTVFGKLVVSPAGCAHYITSLHVSWIVFHWLKCHFWNQFLCNSSTIQYLLFNSKLPFKKCLSYQGRKQV